MATTYKKLFQAQLDSTDTLVHTCPALTRETIIALFLCNTDVSDRTFQLFQVNSGDVIGLANALYYNQVLLTQRTLQGGGIILEPGQMLRGLASVAAKVTVTGFGLATVEAG